jgi:flagellar assembly factor FliW
LVFKGGKTMILSTKNFGDIEIDEDKIISFPEGIPGFEDENKFVIISNPDEENPFHWLQSVNTPGLAFVIINPFLILKDYSLELPSSAVEKLELGSEDDAAVYSIAVVPEKIENITINLLGPIVINWKKKIGGQVILDDEKYSTKYRVFPKDTASEVG